MWRWLFLKIWSSTNSWHVLSWTTKHANDDQANEFALVFVLEKENLISDQLIEGQISILIRLGSWTFLKLGLNVRYIFRVRVQSECPKDFTCNDVLLGSEIICKSRPWISKNGVLESPSIFCLRKLANLSQERMQLLYESEKTNPVFLPWISKEEIFILKCNWWENAAVKSRNPVTTRKC